MAKGVARITVPKLNYSIVFDQEKNRFVATVVGDDEKYLNLEGYGRTAKASLENLGKKIVKPVINI